MVGPAPSHRRRWSNLVPICLALIVIVEIASLGRLDMAEKAAAVEHYWTTSFYFPSSTTAGGGGSDATSSETPSLPIPLDADEEGDRNCEKWLEREDAVDYERDFSKHPVIVSGVDQDWSSCSVGCKFGDAGDRVADASFGLPQDPAVFSVLRSMESSHYYAENNIDLARRRGYKIIMTTSLSSDVPVGYFSWAEYDIMAPLLPKTEEALAAAFISNCGARNFRLQSLEMLEKLDIKIDSYGSCHRNRDGKVDKVEALKRYKFSLAFENSNEEDYVTEKFFQSLVAGSVPIVVGAPNIQDFAPSPGSILHIKELKDVDSVAKTMRHLAENPDAFNQAVRNKMEKKEMRTHNILLRTQSRIIMRTHLSRLCAHFTYLLFLDGLHGSADYWGVTPVVANFGTTAAIFTGVQRQRKKALRFGVSFHHLPVKVLRGRSKDSPRGS